MGAPFAARCRATLEVGWETVQVPNQPKTPNRTVRVPDDVWDAAKKVAAGRGELVSDVIRAALECYVRDAEIFLGAIAPE